MAEAGDLGGEAPPGARLGGGVCRLSVSSLALSLRAPPARPPPFCGRFTEGGGATCRREDFHPREEGGDRIAWTAIS